MYVIYATWWWDALLINDQRSFFCLWAGKHSFNSDNVWKRKSDKETTHSFSLNIVTSVTSITNVTCESFFFYSTENMKECEMKKHEFEFNHLNTQEIEVKRRFKCYFSVIDWWLGVSYVDHTLAKLVNQKNSPSVCFQMCLLFGQGYRKIRSRGIERKSK